MKNIDKIEAEITKTKTKLSELQVRLRELERQKTETENADIVALVRGIDIPPDEFAAFVRAYKERKEYPVIEKSAIDTQIEKEDTAIEN